MKISRQQFLFAFGVIALAIVISLGILWFTKENRYVAVRLATGELYFGQISWWPKPVLSKVWLIQVDQQGNAALDRFENLLWRPSGALHLNRKQIVYWAYLDPNGPAAQAIEGKLQPPPAPAAIPSPAASPIQ